MIEFQATYFDGISSKAFSVKVRFDGMHFRVKGDEVAPEQIISIDDCEIDPPVGGVCRRVKLPNGACCETNDLKAIALLEQAVGRNRGMRLVSLLENRWWIVVGCLLILSAWVWVFISFGIPFLAEKVAYKVPFEISEKVNLEALKFLDSRILTRSNLDNEKVNELNNVFQGLHGEFGSEFEYRLEFRKSPNIGPNAFALPSGLIILTDELVALVQSEKELVAVLVHEMTHVEKRHGLRSLFQDTGVFLLISALVGDVASITSAANILPTLLVESGYSRKFEREADREAGLYLIKKNGSTQPYQDILQRLSDHSTRFPSASVFSTHPDFDERIRDLKQLE